MRVLLGIIALMYCMSSGAADADYYYVGDDKVFLEKVDDSFSVSIETDQEIVDALADKDITVASAEIQKVNHENAVVFAEKERAAEWMARLSGDAYVRYVYPGYRTENGERIFITNLLFIDFKNDVNDGVI